MRVKKPKTNDENEETGMNISNLFNDTLNEWETGFNETPFKTPAKNRATHYTRKKKPNFNHKELYYITMQFWAPYNFVIRYFLKVALLLN